MTASVRPDRPRETGVGVGRLGPREPAARWLRVVLGWSVAAVGLLAAVGCRLQLPAAPTEPWTIPVHPITYTGVVFEPHSRATGRYGSTGDPIPGARVTIVGGQPDGWTTLTDAEGRFAFEDYLYCELKSAECLSRRFRVEKAGVRDAGRGCVRSRLQQWLSSLQCVRQPHRDGPRVADGPRDPADATGSAGDASAVAA